MVRNADTLKRVVTAIVLAGLAIPGILLLKTMLFAVVIGVISASATWEWCCLERTKNGRGSKFVFALFVGTGVPTSLLFPAVLPWVIGAAVFWWLKVAFFIFLREKRSELSSWQAKKWHAVLIIFPAAAAIAGLHAFSPEGRWYVLACLLIVWTTDICAYMVGRAFGKVLLARSTSPGKTVEGFFGGLVGALVVGLILYFTLPLEIVISGFGWMMLVFLTSLFSVLGDLAESAYKRGAGLKDSGRILPGHGGILDRIDSAVASLPLFVAVILLVK